MHERPNKKARIENWEPDPRKSQGESEPVTRRILVIYSSSILEVVCRPENLRCRRQPLAMTIPEIVGLAINVLVSRRSQEVHTDH